MAGRPRKQRIVALRDRKLYLRFTEVDYALLSRLGVLTGRCPADAAYDILQRALADANRYNPALMLWWQQETIRIVKEAE